MAIDIEQAGAVLGFVHQMVVPDLVVQGGRLGHERQLQNEILCERSSADTRKQRASAQHQAARVSSDVAEVANRPKNRPGRRERSSITMSWAVPKAALVRSRTILNF
jgi:hypothetical protein